MKKQAADIPGPTNDPAALLARAYDDYAADLYRYALMILADHALAEDAVQQAFMKMMKLGKRALGVASPEGYLRTAVRNECYTLIKKRRRHTDAVKLLSSKPILETVDHQVADSAEHEQLETAIRKLPPDQREILHLKIYEDKTFRQIAELLEVSANTAASRYRYAIDKLKNILK